MSKDYFEGAGFIIGQMLEKGAYYKEIEIVVKKASYSDSKLPEHLRWMLKNNYKIFTEDGVQLFSCPDISKSSVKLICKNALDRKAAFKNTDNQARQGDKECRGRLLAECFEDGTRDVTLPNDSEETILQEIIYFWINVSTCRNCNLPEGFRPQVRTFGNNYRPGGVVFMQINPGNIGSTDEEELNQRYKNNSAWLCKAKQKREGAQKIFLLQNDFYRSKTNNSFQELNTEIKRQMKCIWGRSSGEFVDTIESHGVKFEDTCVLNLAQCAIPNDKYTRNILATCYDINTNKLLKILRPKCVVAQGSQVYKFLCDKVNGDFVLIKGVHQSSRMSNAEKGEIFSKARENISNALFKK